MNRRDIKTKICEIAENTQSKHCFLLVLENFGDISALIPQICSSSDYKWIIYEFKGIEDYCKFWEYPARKEKALGLFPKLWLKINRTGSYASRIYSLRGLTDKFPLYTAIGHRPQNALPLESYLQLLSQLLIARLTEKKSAAKIPTTFFDNALSSARSLAKTNAHNDIAKPIESLLPKSVLSPLDYYFSLQINNDIPQIANICIYLEVTLELIYGDLSHRFLKKQDNACEEDDIDIPYISYTEGPDSDDDSDDDDYFSSLYFHFPDKSFFPSFEEDLDTQPGYDILIHKQVLPEKELRRISTSAAYYIARSNQLFDFSWNELNQQEMMILLDILEGTSDFNRKIDLKTRAQLNLMFWAGLSPVRLASLSCYDDLSGNIDNDVFNPDTGILGICSQGPKLLTHPEQRTTDQAHGTTKQIRLPLPPMAIEAIKGYYDCTGARRDGERLFAEMPGKIQNNCQKIITRSKRKSPSRLTLTRIYKQVGLNLSRLPKGDIAAAALCMGQDYLQARTAIHYAAFEESHLHSLYYRACNNILKDTGRTPVKLQLPTENTNKHLGTPYRVKLEYVQDLVRKIKERIQSYGQITDGNWREFHNLYCAYTALFIAFSSAHRAVKNPYIPPALIDFKTSLATVRDKKAADYSDTRMVWLPPECLQQIIHYQGHVEKLKRKRAKLCQLRLPSDCLFFLYEGQRARDISPQTLSSYFANEGYFARPNASRHHLKSEAQENLCPIDVIEAIMGHWLIGLEPWTKASSLHPDDFLKAIREHLPRLLEPLQFEALEGLHD